MRILLSSLAVSAVLIAPHAQAETTDNLTNLHEAVKVKVERYCPQTLTKEDVEALKKDEIIKIDDVDFYAEENKAVPTVEDETLVLCTGRYSQNRSNPGRVDCSFCKEENTKTPLLSINVRTTKEVDEILAEREEEETIEVSENEAQPEVETKTEIQS